MAANSVSTKKPNFEGKDILIAEDTEINKEIVKVFLQPTKADLTFTSDGIEVFDAFKSDPEKYDLILMDVQMPRMDGLEATRKIRALDTVKAKTVPILALTVNVSPKDIAECIKAGMNGHIGKPVEINTLFEVIKKYMPESAESAKAESVAETKENAYSKYMPYIDVKEGIARLMNDKNIYFRLLKSFEGVKFANDLINSIKSGDYKTASIVAHTIKGISANLSLHELWELSKEVEAQAKANNVPAGFIDEIKDVIDKTMQMIAELTSQK
ncbi:MAG: response regulator [Endomicrobia bacterium]|nr:response regulator [Endomicrobiia bacterium]MCL2799625.1 response regulator [Endomicrobiia bacterium]